MHLLIPATTGQDTKSETAILFYYNDDACYNFHYHDHYLYCDYYCDYFSYSCLLFLSSFIMSTVIYSLLSGRAGVSERPCSSLTRFRRRCNWVLVKAFSLSYHNRDL